MPRYEKVKRFNLFKEDKEPGSRLPDVKNSKVVLEVPLQAGRYSIAGWIYEDTGNISVEIQKVIEEDQAYTPAASAAPAPQASGGFDD